MQREDRRSEQTYIGSHTGNNVVSGSIARTRCDSPQHGEPERSEQTEVTHMPKKAVEPGKNPPPEKARPPEEVEMSPDFKHVIADYMTFSAGEDSFRVVVGTFVPGGTTEDRRRRIIMQTELYLGRGAARKLSSWLTAWFEKHPDKAQKDKEQK